MLPSPHIHANLYPVPRSAFLIFQSPLQQSSVVESDQQCECYLHCIEFMLPRVWLSVFICLPQLFNFSFLMPTTLHSAIFPLFLGPHCESSTYGASRRIYCLKLPALILTFFALLPGFKCTTRVLLFATSCQ